MKMKKNIFYLVLVLQILFMGCSGNYGILAVNPVLVKDFKTGQTVLPAEYNYYYCGRSTLPYAVVGIDPGYTFADRLWHKIDTREDVYKKIDNLVQMPLESYSLIAADILDSSGKKYGVWFSYYYTTIVRIVPETNVIEVYNPYNPNDYSQF